MSLEKTELSPFGWPVCKRRVFAEKSFGLASFLWWLLDSRDLLWFIWDLCLLKKVGFSAGICTKENLQVEQDGNWLSIQKLNSYVGFTI